MKLKNVLLILVMSTMVILVGCTRKVGNNDVNPKNNNKELSKQDKVIDDKVVDDKDNDDKKPETPKEEVKIEDKEVLKTAILYFPDDNAEYVIPEARIVEKVEALELLHELQKGSVLRDRTYMFSKKININSVKVEDKIAIIDFDESIRGKINGSAGETLTIASIVNTLTLNKSLGIDKVRFSQDGIPMGSLGGHMDTSLPIGSMKEFIKK